MSLLEAVVLGVVQGITEFLPISSTAHLRIVPALLGWADPGAAYSAVIQLGTVAAVLTYFRRDLVLLTAAFFKGLKTRQPFETHESRLAWFVGLGTLPIVICGFAFKGFIKHELRSLYVIAASMIVLAVVLWLAERMAAAPEDHRAGDAEGRADHRRLAGAGADSRLVALGHHHHRRALRRA